MEQLKKDIIPAILQQTKIEIAGTLNNAGMIGALRHFLIQESLQPFNKITTLIESNKHMLTKGETTIANYIITNLDEVPDFTISEMAKKIDVSSSMLTRFCKKLGIDSYSKFRLMAKEAIVGGRIHDKPDTTSLIEVKQDYITILNKLETLNEGYDVKEFAARLKNVNRIFFYGLGEMSFVVTQIKYKLMELGIIVDCFSHKYEMEKSKELLNPETVVVGLSLSGSDSEIHHLFEVAKVKGSLTVGITSQKDTPIYCEAELSYLIPSSNGNALSSVNETSTLLLLEVLFKELNGLRKKVAVEEIV
ncbi:putative HTH-type transcriptional regulator [Lentibacillus sp. JNUCC-1]|uniref:MurR/RpiR family transcriptional regulator n=1 Tax=Lentibacillus sp. JNUCC-1 TaxID=2654513 RepID=UPI0012E91F4A|nr:MurR/RpiR family transcriptional regulator [Lentibacillus sp. JNUCC-1]MUV36984.1 putative HTH-type transcriptional regulator [Lentibacillus sp. JNUCC-1]